MFVVEVEHKSVMYLVKQWLAHGRFNIQFYPRGSNFCVPWLARQQAGRQVRLSQNNV